MTAEIEETVSIRALVSMADALMHGVPSKDDVETSVSRLIAAGLVDAYAEELWLTETGSALFDESMAGTSPTTAMLNLGHKWAESGFPPSAPRTWAVPPGSM
jgi:hypothetical protein